MNFDPKSLAGREPTKNAGGFDPTKWSFVTLFKLLFVSIDGSNDFYRKKMYIQSGTLLYRKINKIR
jgi:hypothetical protein